jgi:hypothetical protein
MDYLLWGGLPIYMPIIQLATNEKGIYYNHKLGDRHPILKNLYCTSGANKAKIPYKMGKIIFP